MEPDLETTTCILGTHSKNVMQAPFGRNSGFTWFYEATCVEVTGASSQTFITCSKGGCDIASSGAIEQFFLMGHFSL